MIAALPGVAAIRDAPVPENEGVYLQGAIPHTALHGRPMHFATDPAQHHVEGSRFDTLGTRRRLVEDWAPWFTPADAPWRVEKSPVNLTRMRLLQQLFPLSQFVVVIRHPQAVAGAVAKWVTMDRADAIGHWIAAHDRVRDDLDHLHAAMVVRYEDVVARPDGFRAAMAAFLDLRDGGGFDEALRDGNRDHPGWTFDRAEARAVAWAGYGSGMTAAPVQPDVRHPLRRVREATLAALSADPARG